MAPLIALALKLLPSAPGLVKLLTGNDKAGEVAAHVLDIAKVVTGAKDSDNAVAIIQEDPIFALKFKLAMEDRQAALENMYLLDTQNARAMQIAALGQEDVFSKRFVYYFAAAWSLFSMIYFMAVTFAPPPADGVRIADTILGVLIASVIGVMFAYFYGTTRASKTKDDTINRLSSN